MQLISCHDGKLHRLNSGDGDTTFGGGAAAFNAPVNSARGAFRTGLAALDALAPGEAFALGAVHELLSEPNAGSPLFVAMLLARAATCDANARAVIWCDPREEIYPPALAAHGVPLERLFLLRPRDPRRELMWAVAECLRCKGVGAVVAAPPTPMSRLEARRLQLAAERGGGAGVLLRPAGRASAEYAAATRWLVRPAPGERTVQRWRVELVHGHGGRVGQAVLLEHSREYALTTARPATTTAQPAPVPVRAADQLADRPPASDRRATA